MNPRQFSQPVLTLPSSATGAGLRLAHGAAPTSPVNGDVWTTSAGVFAQINGVTVGPLAGATSADVIAVTLGLAIYATAVEDILPNSLVSLYDGDVQTAGTGAVSALLVASGYSVGGMSNSFAGVVYLYGSFSGRTTDTIASGENVYLGTGGRVTNLPAPKGVPYQLVGIAIGDSTGTHVPVRLGLGEWFP